MTISFVFTKRLKNHFLTKRQSLIIESAVSHGGQGKLTYFMYFIWPPLEAGQSISPFFLFSSGRKLSFLIYALLMIRQAPKKITQHQVLVSTVFIVN
jgi:hypothetical protein